jgi:hypothetical protein
MLPNAPVVPMVNGKTKMWLPNMVVKDVRKVDLLLMLNKHVLIVQLDNTKNTPLRNLTVATRVPLEKNLILHQPRVLIAVLVNTKIKIRRHLSRVHHGQFALLESTSMDCLLCHQTMFVAIVNVERINLCLLIPLQRVVIVQPTQHPKLLQPRVMIVVVNVLVIHADLVNGLNWLRLV